MPLRFSAPLLGRVVRATILTVFTVLLAFPFLLDDHHKL